MEMFMENIEFTIKILIVSCFLIVAGLKVISKNPALEIPVVSVVCLIIINVARCMQS